MKISFVEKTDNFARVELKIVKEDYQEAIDKKLKQLRRTVKIPGFRPGTVPAGMVQKMYGEAVKIEEVQNIVSEKLYKFFVDEDLKTIGQTISTPGSEPVDVVKSEEMIFSFDQALMPEITNLPDKSDKFTYYKAEADAKTVDEALQQSLDGAGERVEADVVSEDDFLKGSIAELDGDLPKEGGIRLEGTGMLLPRYISNEEEKAKFVGAPKNSVVIFSPFKAFDGKAAEIASLLSIDKEAVPALEGKEFSFEISSIMHHKAAELGQEFYDKVFGKDIVKSEEEARAKVKEFIEGRSEADSNFKFLTDVKAYITEHKLDAIVLHEPTIKAWWKTTDSMKNVSDEEAEKLFPRLIKDLKLDIYLNALAKKYDVTVTEEEIGTFAKEMTAMQFRQYGMATLPDNLLEQYSKNMLKDENMKARIEESIREQKIGIQLKGDVTIEEKALSLEDFNALLNPAPATEETTNEE